MGCCSQVYNLGCFDGCDAIVLTGFNAAATGDHTFEFYHVNGAVQEETGTWQLSNDKDILILTHDDATITIPQQWKINRLKNDELCLLLIKQELQYYLYQGFCLIKLLYCIHYPILIFLLHHIYLLEKFQF